MKTLLKALNAELADHKIEIRPYRSTTKFVNAKYLVRIQTGSPRTMSDGTEWDGYEHIGHFNTLENAAAAARETAKGRN